MGRLQHFVVLVSVASLGCSLAPEPRQPTSVAELPEAFAETRAAGEYEPSTWWKAYDDPILEGLVDSALAANLDLAEAVARVEEARAIVGITSADLLPGVTGRIGASRREGPVNADVAAVMGAILGGGSEGFSAEAQEPWSPKAETIGDSRSTIELYSASLSFAYELDFWGRARNDRKAALADLTASAYDFQVIQLGVLAETISAYFDLIELETRLRLTEEVVDVLTERETLSVVRYNRGLIGSFELYSVRQDRQAAEATIPQIRSQVGETRRRLALVTGRHLDRLDLLLSEAGAGPRPAFLSAPIPSGVPADLLVQRPDVRSSAARLEASRLRVGARKAELLPRITLTGTLGLESTSASDLLDLSDWFSNLAAGLIQPLFQGGRLRANLDAAEARHAQRLAAHGMKVLTAVGEVETALLRHREELDRYQTLSDQLSEARFSVSLQSERYQSGVGEYTDYLDALRILLTTQNTLSASARDVAVGRLAVHRALGGSWVRPQKTTSMGEKDR